LRNSNFSKIAVAGAAASLCFATAAPALAHGTSTSTDPNHTKSAPTLAQQQAWLDSYIAKAQQRLQAFAAKVAADPNLTAAQKADWAAKIAAKQAALDKFKSAVDAATTTDELHAAVKAAMQGAHIHGFGGWAGFFNHNWNDPDHNRDPVRTGSAHTGPRASTDHRHSDPAATQPRPAQTVVLRSQLQGSNDRGKHWGGQHRAGDRAHSGSTNYQPRHGFGGSGNGGSHDLKGGHHR